ncbi:NAD-dependent malic enzyme, partial [Clostridium perfringens]
AGAAGIAIANLIFEAGFHNVVICDRYGIITSDNSSNKYQKECAIKFNKNETGTLKEVLVGADAFIGVSAGNILTKEMAESMSKDAIIFALANPTPEIMPEVAKEANVKVIATGRSDYPNQINNLLVFPGIIKGALKARVNKITTEMQLE